MYNSIHKKLSMSRCTVIYKGHIVCSFYGFDLFIYFILPIYIFWQKAFSALVPTYAFSMDPTHRFINGTLIEYVPSNVRRVSKVAYCADIP